MDIFKKLKKLLECFAKKKLQNANQKNFRIENVIKRTGDKLYVKWKNTIIRLIAG